MTPDDSMLSVWNATALRSPNATALTDATTGRRWSRRELDEVAQEWSASRAHLAGQAVAFAEPNGAEWMRVFLGILKADGVAVPLDFGEPAAAQQASAAAARATFLWREGTLEALGTARRRPRDRQRLVKLTSGSTGAPRPLYFTDAQMLADGRQICAGMEICPDDVNLGIIPWGHSYGLGNLVMPLLLQGTALLFNVPPLPHAIAAAAVQHRPTVFPAVPALLRALADSDIRAEDLQSLRTIISAGAPLTPEIAKAFEARFARKVHSFYGSSETGGISYDRSGDSAALDRGVGRPLPGVKLELGRGGRFTVSSPAVFTVANRRNGSHRMADIGRIDASGELVLLGRAGRFVKIAGRRLNLAEVEHVIKKLPGVRDALVVPHAERADALAAAIATDELAASLRQALRDRLASWKIPKKIVTLPAFPLTARGKTDARQLRERLAQPS